MIRAGVPLVVALALPALLRAQALPEQLTVDDAVRIAHANSPAHRMALNDAHVASAQVRQAYGAFLPTLGASLGFNGSATQTSTGQGDFGEVIGGEERTVESSSGSQGVSARMTLFDGGARFREVGAARAQEDAVAAAIAAATNQLDAAVRRSYFEA
ncbi:MAG: TolC family protein, partial [Longimicrobiales bacterium]